MPVCVFYHESDNFSGRNGGKYHTDKKSQPLLLLEGV